MSDPLAYQEKELLQQVADGSETAFRTLFNLYRRRLYSYVFKITESRETAEDAVQDIFLKLWDRRHTLPGIENISAYLHRMAYNFAYHGFRQLAKESLLLDHLRSQSPHSTYNPVDTVVSREVKVYIQTVVDRLTPQQRKVFLLSREGGLKQEEIARRLGISIFAVKKHMVDALRFLRDEISQQYGPQAIAVIVVFGF